MENAQEVELWIKREDEAHPEVSGNKWRKLRYSLQWALEHGATRLVTFGGAYSNHVLATASAAEMAGLECLIFIRGESLKELNPTLTKAKSFGAQLVYLDRATYRLKDKSDAVNRHLKPTDYLIPEGGNDSRGVKGCTEILKPEDKVFDYVACCQGTGGTAAGLLASLSSHQHLLSFPALKGDFFESDIRRALNHHSAQVIEAMIDRLIVHTDYHCGGYAKWTPDLLAFMRFFKKQSGILLDPIYTGKMMMGLYDLLGKGQFKSGTKILAIHTGGLQGIVGFQQRFDLEIYPVHT